MNVERKSHLFYVLENVLSSNALKYMSLNAKHIPGIINNTIMTCYYIVMSDYFHS